MVSFLLLAAFAAAASLLVPGISWAQVTLPDIGVDPAEYVTATGTSVGGAIAACFGLFAAILAVIVALRWIRKAVS